LVVLLSKRKSKCEREIIEILKNYGANHISDKFITENENTFTVISIYKKTDIILNRGIAVFTEKSIRLKHQSLPIGVIGICEDNNEIALETYKQNHNAVITCGTGNKNTITISSISNNTIFLTIQRTIINQNGKKYEPCEIKIELSKSYTPFSVMAAATILILYGITPNKF
jgi:hypothetical protein